MKTYKAAVVGCSRIGAFIDNEHQNRPDIPLPSSHSAGYEACDRTDLVAGADLREDVLEMFGNRYDVPASRRYTDYKAMIEREQPDILSVATQPEQHAEVAIYAAEHGVRAIYCEKPLCTSLEEAQRIADAVARNGVAFNMGTNRRWHPGFDVMAETIAGGELGKLQTLIVYNAGPLFNTGSHYLDLMLRLNGDVKPAWAQGFLTKGYAIFAEDDKDAVTEDPTAEGTIGFANGVTLYMLRTSLPGEHQAICENGVLTATNNGAELYCRRRESAGRGARMGEAVRVPFTQVSSTLRLIEDLVHALDTGAGKPHGGADAEAGVRRTRDAGEPTRGGAGVAVDNMQMIFGLIESQRQGGARVDLPLRDSKLHLRRRTVKQGQPKYAPPVSAAED